MLLDSLLPHIFLLLMAVAVFMYALLDGFDLGVGILLPADHPDYRQKMIASIGPFWDANETWLVLAVGILLIAFPKAHNIILKEFYLPVLVLLVGLILRGVAFDFRAKSLSQFKPWWDKAFTLGSWMATASQGYMLGIYVMGFQYHTLSILFALLSAICVSAAYAYIGGAWLVLKTEHDLQQFAVKRTRIAGYFTMAGITTVCLVNPLINPQVAERWFASSWLSLIPLACFVLILGVDYYLKKIHQFSQQLCWIPFVCIGTLFLLCLVGLAYSFYPYIIPFQLLANEAVGSVASLRFIFYGVVIVLPLILAYTLFSYWVFKGKSTQLNYYS
ncbi:cytochrome d ubiquinol oxidase subunit II [Aliikangiella maris]|uniref:Cytochrome d ubiquinol oxidase subunit II n=2 Tax=Aliikangiella maris TaxID=3162458 RepID=A0ABV2BWY0_9GAMM